MPQLKRKAFTDVELLVAIGIIVALASIVLALFGSRMKTAPAHHNRVETPTYDSSRDARAPIISGSSITVDELQRWESEAGRSPADDAARVRQLIGEVRRLRGN